MYRLVSFFSVNNDEFLLIYYARLIGVKHCCIACLSVCCLSRTWVEINYS